MAFWAPRPWWKARTFLALMVLLVTITLKSYEEIQLDRALVLPPVSGASQHETETPAPAGQFPGDLEETALFVQAVPAFPDLDQRLEGGEALERHADGELHPLGIEGGDDLVTEERAVQDLPGLGDGAERGIVAALALLPGVEADGRALGETADRQHWAVEVQGDADQTQLGELRQDTLTAEMAQVADTTFIQPRQRPAEGGDIRQPSEPEQAQHHGIVPVEAHVLEPTITQQQVDDQQHHHHPVSEDGADLQVAEALAPLSFQFDTGEQSLVKHQAGK